MQALYRLFARSMPTLRLKLIQARMSQSPEEYVKRTVMTSLLLAIAFTIIIFLFGQNFKVLFIFPLLFAIAFFYFYHYADAKIAKRQKEISKEVVFAGRFLLIELESGVPVYQSFQNLAKNYESIGPYFGEVIQKVDLGTSFEDALNEAVQAAPSNDLRRIFWQVLNSLKTGSEVADALNAVFDQIVREQQIQVKEYGRKLNPMAMFYMMMAVIVPSLGTIMIIVLSTFVGFALDMLFFSVLLGINVIVQLLFVAAIKSQRPPVDL